MPLTAAKTSGRKNVLPNRCMRAHTHVHTHALNQRKKVCISSQILNHLTCTVVLAWVTYLTPVVFNWLCVFE